MATGRENVRLNVSVLPFRNRTWDTITRTAVLDTPCRVLRTVVHVLRPGYGECPYKHRSAYV